MHRSVAGYHRMFFERNIPVALPSARGLTAAALKRYKLVIVPYPLLMSGDVAAALEAYVRDGGHLFVEARAGWQDERGHAQPVLPGFGWHRLLGVRETQVLPVKQANVRWGDRQFSGTGFVEQFEALAPDARIVATFEDGTPAAFERRSGTGRAMILGTFAGERNAQEPVPMHPLGDALVEWAGLTRSPLTSSSFVEVRRMTGPSCEWVFLFNHGVEPAQVEYVLDARREIASAREVVMGTPLTTQARRLRIAGTIPAEATRVYRIDVM
jgi:beta-galactosidase